MTISLDNRPKILIADDHSQIRSLLCQLLEERYDCSQASSAEEALKLLDGEKFDLILADITMNRMSGLEMIPHVKRAAPDTVVVMISGEQTIETALKAVRAGAFDYITKPLDLDDVELVVRRALGHQAIVSGKRQYEAYLEESVRKQTAEITHLSYHDVLTGLPNRALFEERLVQALSWARRNQAILAVLILRIDRFELFNNSLGRGAGDELLLAVADRISTVIGDQAKAARVGGDEFAVLLTHLREPDEAIEFGRSICEALSRRFECGGHELYLTLSVGISLYPDDGQDANALMKNAGAALHASKKEGGNTFRRYDSEMNAGAIAGLILEGKLRSALEKDQFEVFYQARVKVETGEIVGAEALVRWRHPEMGIVPPSLFIHVAEETGLILPVGEWVLRTACAQAKAWQDRFQSPLQISVNLSARQFRQSDLAERIESALMDSGLDASFLELELTESSMMIDLDTTISRLRTLRKMGVGIAIDDFGTGYSSISYLKKFPINVLKIDQSFLHDAAINRRDAAIVKTIIMLAHSLDLKAVAEGVEMPDQLDLLREFECDEAQGYLFSKPISAAEFADLYGRETHIGIYAGRERSPAVGKTGQKPR